MDDAVDRISNLPPNVTEHILQCLPLKDAVMTSVLSTYWRYKWALLPQLVLDRPFFRSIQKVKDFDEGYFDNIYSGESLVGGMLEYSSIVNNILLCHDGPILKFVLYIPSWFTKDEDISHWIHFASRKMVKEFKLFKDFWCGQGKLPSTMFSCLEFNHLTHLTLVNWSLSSVSTTFSGFPSLISLELHWEDSSIEEANKVGILVSKCPLLENLDLVIYEKESCLTIHAPELQNLVVHGCLSGIFLEETESIKMLTLDVELDHSRDLMMEFCSCLPLVEKLILGSYFLGNFLGDAGHPPEKLNNNLLSKFRELKNLRLDGVLLDCHCSISYLVCLLNMAPKLQTLEIWVVLEDEPAANSITIVGDWFLDHLKSAKIIAGVLTSSHGSALQLIKKILSSSPVLEVMTITARIQPYTKFNIAKELLQCRRASANAEIIFNLT